MSRLNGDLFGGEAGHRMTGDAALGAGRRRGDQRRSKKDSAMIARRDPENFVEPMSDSFP
ncbi:hypothetical protein ACFQZ4_48910 [Catellatospora coxensis]